MKKCGVRKTRKEDDNGKARCSRLNNGTTWIKTIYTRREVRLGSVAAFCTSIDIGSSFTKAVRRFANDTQQSMAYRARHTEHVN